MWAYTRHARNFFFNHLPFTEMAPQTDLADDEDHLVFANPGEIYAMYLREGGNPTLDLAANVGNYRVKWYNPRYGGGLLHGSVTSFTRAGVQSLGTPPNAEDEDWVVLVENIGFSGYASATYTYQQAVDNPLKLEFDASAAASNGGSLTSYNWDFGDGTTGTGVSPSHTYQKAGTYQPVLTVTDSQGNTDEYSSQIAVIPVAGQASSGLWGTYYNNTTLSGTPETRLDPRVNFKWGNGIPIRLVDEDEFSVRWEGHILPDYSETYDIRLEAEDGARLWIDDVLLIDTWDLDGYSNTTTQLALQAGQFKKIKIEMVANTGRADIRLFWTSPSLIEEIIPEQNLFYAPDIILPVSLTRFAWACGWRCDGADLGNGIRIEQRRL